MQFIRRTNEEKEIFLYHPNGGCLEMKCLEEEARVLAVDVQKGEVEKGVELLAAAETVAHRRKKKTLIFDFPDAQKDLYQIFAGAGYEIETKDSVLSVQTKDLVASDGVTKLSGCV